MSSNIDENDSVKSKAGCSISSRSDKVQDNQIGTIKSVHSQKVTEVDKQYNSSKNKNNRNDTKTQKPELDSRDKEGRESSIQVNTGISICQNCLTTTTPLWRRDENGHIMCNACGLFLKLHGRKRPISLKTDVIKSRNRSNRNATSVNKKRNVANAEDTAALYSNTSLEKKVSNRQPSHTGSNNLKKREVERLSQDYHHSTDMFNQNSVRLPVNVPVPGMPVVYPGSPILGAYTGIYSSSPLLHPVSNILQTPLINGTQQGTGTFCLGQPRSPQILAQTTQNSNIWGDVMIPRGAMSEQLVPNSPDNDKIPRLTHIPVSQFRDQHASNSDLTKPTTKPKFDDHHHNNSAKSRNSGTTTLETRISELELINDLLKRRIQDLEYSENELHKKVRSLEVRLGLEQSSNTKSDN